MRNIHNFEGFSLNEAKTHPLVISATTDSKPYGWWDEELQGNLKKDTPLFQKMLKADISAFEKAAGHKLQIINYNSGTVGGGEASYDVDLAFVGITPEQAEEILRSKKMKKALIDYMANIGSGGTFLDDPEAEPTEAEIKEILANMGHSQYGPEKAARIKQEKKTRKDLEKEFTANVKPTIEKMKPAGLSVNEICDMVKAIYTSEGK